MMRCLMVVLSIWVGEGSSLVFSKGEGSVIMGQENAPVEMVVYSSLDCGHCKEFHVETLPALMESLVDSGHVKIVLKEFPLSQQSLFAAMAVRCCGESAYEENAQKLFQYQKEWASLEGDTYKEAIAQRLGIPLQDILDFIQENRDLEDSLLQQRLDAEQKLDIHGLPAFVIKSSSLSEPKILLGAQSLEEFEKALNP